MKSSNIPKSIPIVRYNHQNIPSGTLVNGPTNRLSNNRLLSQTVFRTVRPKKSRGLIQSHSLEIEKG